MLFHKNLYLTKFTTHTIIRTKNIDNNIDPIRRSFTIALTANVIADAQNVSNPIVSCHNKNGYNS